VHRGRHDDAKTTFQKGLGRLGSEEYGHAEEGVRGAIAAANKAKKLKQRRRRWRARQVHTDSSAGNHVHPNKTKQRSLPNHRGVPGQGIRKKSWGH